MVSVPEGHQILAGGETTGTEPNALPSPERATDETWSIALSGLAGFLSTVPVVPPSSTTG